MPLNFSVTMEKPYNKRAFIDWIDENVGIFRTDWYYTDCIAGQ